MPMAPFAYVDYIFMSLQHQKKQNLLQKRKPRSPPQQLWDQHPSTGSPIIHGLVSPEPIKQPMKSLIHRNIIMRSLQCPRKWVCFFSLHNTYMRIIHSMFQTVDCLHSIMIFCSSGLRLYTKTKLTLLFYTSKKLCFSFIIISSVLRSVTL